MVALSRILAVALAAAFPAPQAMRARPSRPVADPGSAAPAIARWRPTITEAARRFAIPEAWIAAVIQVESGGHASFDGRPVTSRAGAMGLMQLMPATWNALRARLALGADPYDPHDNIIAGAAYLRLMDDRYGYPGMFAAYNAGPTRYDAALRGNERLPAETRAYLARLGDLSAPPAMPSAVLSGTRLFFELGPTRADADTASAQPPSIAGNGLFVTLTDPHSRP